MVLFLKRTNSFSSKTFDSEASKYLNLMDRYSKDKIDKKMFKTFGDHCLKQDVIIVLRLIGKNTNQVIMGEIISVLWDHFKDDQDTV